MQEVSEKLFPNLLYSSAPPVCLCEVEAFIECQTFSCEIRTERGIESKSGAALGGLIH